MPNSCLEQVFFPQNNNKQHNTKPLIRYDDRTKKKLTFFHPHFQSRIFPEIKKKYSQDSSDSPFSRVFPRGQNFRGPRESVL